MHPLFKFEIMTNSANRYQPASASELLSAFRALDPERTGVVSRECIESALRHDGEPFEDEELDEMMSAAAVETSTGNTVVPYELYINKILVIFFFYFRQIVSTM